MPQPHHITIITTLSSRSFAPMISAQHGWVHCAGLSTLGGPAGLSNRPGNSCELASQNLGTEILRLLQVHLGFTVDAEQLNSCGCEYHELLLGSIRYYVNVLISIDLARAVSHQACREPTWTSDSLGCVSRALAT